VSNAIIKQEGAGSLVADNLWEFRLGAPAFVLGLLAGGAGALLLGRLTRGAATGSAAELAATRAPTPTGWPVNFAHRGGRKVVPENTIEGFREATQLGPVVLELDAQSSADGEVVVIHDGTVDRTTDGTGEVARMTLAQLQRLDAGYRFTPDGGATFPWRGKGVTIPTLEAVFREFPDHFVNIELKAERPGTEEAVWRVIEAVGGQARTLAVTNSAPSIKRFRAASGGTVATGASTGEKRQLSGGRARKMSWLKLPSNTSGAPSSPRCTASRSSRTAGSKRRSWPTPSCTPASVTAPSARSASAPVMDSGFSQKTCLPAVAAATIWSAWNRCGVARITASIPSAASTC